MATNPKKKAQTKAKSQVKKQVRKAAKANPGIVIALVLVVVVVVVIAAVLYLKVPAVHDAVQNMFSSSTENDAKNSGNTGNINEGKTPSGNEQENQGDNQTPSGGDNQTPSGGDNQGGGNQGVNPSLVLGDGELKVHFMNVGQGDCIYIQFPDGKDMLIDCGNKSSGFSFKTLKATLDALNPDGEIDHLMLTHGDEDHVEYLDDIIYAYQIHNIYMPNILPDPLKNPDYGKSGKQSTTQNCDNLKAQIDALNPELLALFTDSDTLYTAVYANFFIAALSEENCRIVLNIDKDDGTNSIVISDETTYELRFFCMTEAGWKENTLKDAHEKNEISPVGILTYNGKRIVLTGDSNDGNEAEIAARIGNIYCDVLKVAHHGSETSSLPVFLDAITCEYAVISCNARGNTFYHPRQETLDRLIERNYTIFRTDLNGTVVLTVDSEGNMLFVAEKETTLELLHNGISSEEAKILGEYNSAKNEKGISAEEKEARTNAYNEKLAEFLGY